MTNAPPETTSANPVANDWEWWQCKLAAGAPWTPARMWRKESRDELGRLLCDVEYFAEIDGIETDPFLPSAWPHWQPIRREEWVYLTKRAAWAREHSPADPAAQPDTPIDHNDIPTLF